MRSVHIPLMSMIHSILSGLWIIEEDKEVDEEKVLDCFEQLFKCELEREAKMKYGDNPYKANGAPFINVHLNTIDYTYHLFNDENSFFACLVSGLTKRINNKALCFNLNQKGVEKPYFKYMNKPTDGWIDMTEFYASHYKFDGAVPQNFRRLISLFYERLFCIFKSWTVDEEMFPEYSIEEKTIIKSHF